MASYADREHGNIQPVCQNCTTSTTPLWRRDEMGSVLCNACGLFLKLHGTPRPISLKTDVIKSRNRVKIAGQGHKRKVRFNNLTPSTERALTTVNDSPYLMETVFQYLIATLAPPLLVRLFIDESRTRILPVTPTALIHQCRGLKHLLFVIPPTSLRSTFLTAFHLPKTSSSLLLYLNYAIPRPAPRLPSTIVTSSLLKRMKGFCRPTPPSRHVLVS